MNKIKKPLIITFIGMLLSLSSVACIVLMGSRISPQISVCFFLAGVITMGIGLFIGLLGRLKDSDAYIAKMEKLKKLHIDDSV